MDELTLPREVRAIMDYLQANAPTMSIYVHGDLFTSSSIIRLTPTKLIELIKLILNRLRLEERSTTTTAYGKCVNYISHYEKRIDSRRVAYVSLKYAICPKSAYIWGVSGGVREV